MIPLYDSVPTRSRPVVNYAILAITSAVFLLQLLEGSGGSSLIERFGLIPARLLDLSVEVPITELVLVRGNQLREVVRPAEASPLPTFLTLFTCMFLHGGWLHFLGNMWSLWIFGDNVEDHLGHRGYALFYLGTGLAASLAQFLVDVDSTIPTIGASGAIAGVMGAYFLLYPRARVVVLVPLGFLFWTTAMPAPIFLGLWFFLQLFQGAFATGAGVAWWAHIGGFVAGYLVVRLLGGRNGSGPRPQVLRARSNDPVPVDRRRW